MLFWANKNHKMKVVYSLFALISMLGPAVGFEEESCGLGVDDLHAWLRAEASLFIGDLGVHEVSLMLQAHADALQARGVDGSTLCHAPASWLRRMVHPADSASSAVVRDLLANSGATVGYSQGPIGRVASACSRTPGRSSPRIEDPTSRLATS